MKNLFILFLLSYTLWSCQEPKVTSDDESSQIEPSDEQPFFKLSLAQWSLNREMRSGDMNPMAFAEQAKNMGFEGIEYVTQLYNPILKGDGYTKLSMDELVAEMKAKSEEHGMENVLIMVDGEGDLSAVKEADRDEAVEKHKKWVDAAAELGCHSIRVNLFGAETAEEWKTTSIDGLSKLSDYAATKGVNVIVENHGGFSSNAKLLMEVMAGVGKDNCGTLPDFGNFCLKKEGGVRWGAPCVEEYDIYKGMEELMPKAFAVSAKSYEFNEEGDETKLDYYRIMKTVKDAGYTGYVGVEFEGEADAKEGILATKELLIKAAKAL